MSFAEPVGVGIRIKTLWADIWVGWDFAHYEHSESMVFLHLHFLPDTPEVCRKIYDHFKPFCEYIDILNADGGFKFFMQESYHGPHGDYGCLMGQLGLKNEHPKVAEALQGIEQDGIELRSRLRPLLKHIFGVEA